MIRIVTNGIDLNLYSSTQIEMNMQNPLFNEGSFIPGSYSLPFDIPLSDKNKITLDYPGEISNHKKFEKSLKVVIYINGVVYNSGVLEVIGVSDVKVRASINIGLGSLGDDFKEQKINELSDVQVDMLGGSGVEKWVQFHVENSIVFTAHVKINGVIFNGYSSVSAALAATDIVSKLNASDDYSATTEAGDNFKVYPKDKTNFDAFLSIETPVVTLTTYVNDYLSGYNSQIIAYLNQYLTATPPDTAFAFPIIRNIFYFQDEPTTTYWPTVNQTLGGAYKESLSSFTSTLQGRLLIPAVKWTHVFSKIESKFNVKFAGTLFQNADFQSLLFVQKDPFLQTQNEKFPGTFTHLRFRNMLNANERIPDFTISQFFNEIINTFNASISFDPKNRKIYINDRADAIISTDFEEISSISSQYSELNNQENDGVTFKVASAKQNTNSQNWQLVVGDGLQENEIAFHSFLTQNATIEGESFPSISRMGDIEENAKAYQYLFNKGNQTNPDSFIYPQANSESASFDLKIIGSTGLYAKLWEPWTRFQINGNESSRIINFNILQLSNFDFLLKRRILESNYIVKSVQVVFTMSGIKPAKCTLIRVDTHANENTRVA